MKIKDENKNIETLAQIYRFPETRPDLPFDGGGWPNCVEENIFRDTLNERTKVYVELGTWLGASLRLALEMAPNAIGIAIDTWRGDRYIRAPEHDAFAIYNQFLANQWEYRHRVIPITANSWEGLRLIDAFGITPDVIYIDASHEYEDVYKDIKTALELFPTAVICGDDYQPFFDGVIRAVDELAQIHKKNAIIKGGSWRFENPQNIRS